MHIGSFLESQYSIFWRIPIISVQNWKYYLTEFWLEFGFPLGFSRNAPLSSTKENNASASNFADDVCTYIEEELKQLCFFGSLRLTLMILTF